MVYEVFVVLAVIVIRCFWVAICRQRQCGTGGMLAIEYVERLCLTYPQPSAFPPIALPASGARQPRRVTWDTSGPQVLIFDDESSECSDDYEEVDLYKGGPVYWFRQTKTSMLREALARRARR